MNTERIENAYGRGYFDRMTKGSGYRGSSYQDTREYRAYDAGWNHAVLDIEQPKGDVSLRAHRS